MPADIKGWSEAAEPWKRGFAMLDRETILIGISALLGAWLFWSELKPFIAMKGLKPKSERAVNGMFPAELTVEIDRKTGSPSVLKNIGVARFYVHYFNGNSGILFLCFGKDTGTDRVVVSGRNGDPIRHTVLDRSSRSLAIEINSEAKIGFSVRTENIKA